MQNSGTEGAPQAEGPSLKFLQGFSFQITTGDTTAVLEYTRVHTKFSMEIPPKYFKKKKCIEIREGNLKNICY